MFFCDPNRTYQILGVYHVTRNEPFDRTVEGRDYTSIGFRLRGGSRFSTQEGITSVGNGCVVYIPRGVSYRRRTDRTEELIILHLNCHGEDDNEISVFEHSDTRDLFMQMLAIWESGRTGKRNQCMSLLYRIFETLEREQTIDRPTPPPAIEAGVEYLWRNYRDSSLSVSYLASLSHVSEVYFRRLYYATYAESPWQTVLSMRFAYACDCLRSGYYSVTEIAFLCGFSDVKYFRTAFRKQFGKTPTEYVQSGL